MIHTVSDTERAAKPAPIKGESIRLQVLGIKANAEPGLEKEVIDQLFGGRKSIVLSILNVPVKLTRP
jgi:hypothetical protein